MIRLKIVKSKACHSREDPTDEDINHGTTVAKELSKPYANSDHIIVGDSYFASVQCAKELWKIGLRFIGVVKTATRQFPMDHLSSIQLNGRGDHYGLFSKAPPPAGLEPDLMAFTWVDRERHYFISSASNLRPCEPIIRYRTRHDTPIESHELPTRVRLTIPQVNATKVYYDECGRVDQHNRL